MRVFVTGGSGFAGVRLLMSLRDGGIDVAALARDPDAESVVRRLGAEAVPGDLFDPAALARGMAGADAVVHVAGSVQGMEPGEVRRLNVGGTAAALEAARAAGVGRFVHYGASAVIMGEPVPIIHANETAPVRSPRWSPFIATKGEAERLVLNANSPGLTTIALRPSSLWGPGSFLLPELTKLARTGRFAWIAHGDYPVSTCNVDNLTHAAILALDCGRGGAAYFITDGEEVTYRRYVTDQLALVGVDPGDRSVPRAVAWALVGTLERVGGLVGWTPPVTREILRLGGQAFTLDIGAARNDLGYAPAVDRAEGLRRLADSLGGDGK